MKLKNKSKNKLRDLLTEVFIHDVESNKAYYAEEKKKLIRLEATHRILDRLIDRA